jgi:hypothetical protein
MGRELFTEPAALRARQEGEAILMAHDVFISHSAKDRTIAEAVCAMFESRGIRCWIAQRDILPGADWGETIIDAISGSRVMIVIISRNANDSAQVKREVERAVNRGVIIIPFRVENIPLSKALEFHISTTHWMDALTPPLEQHIHRLADRVKALMPNPINSWPVGPAAQPDRRPGTQIVGTPPAPAKTDPPPHQSFPPSQQSFPPSNYYAPRAAPAQYPPGMNPPAAPFYGRQNRGLSKAQTALIVGLVSAVLGFVGIGLVIAPFAIFIGNQEIKAIKAGQSPPSGQGIATAGIICGWVGVGLGGLFVVGFIFGALGLMK